MTESDVDKAILTCALTGVLTNPKQHPVPVTPAQMAAEARDAFNAGASIMHVHLRMQEEGLGHMPNCPTWFMYRSNSPGYRYTPGRLALKRRSSALLRLRASCSARWRVMGGSVRRTGVPSS